MFLQVYLKTLDRFALSNFFLGGECTVLGSTHMLSNHTPSVQLDL